MNLRQGFRDIVDGWIVIDDFDDLTDRIERTAEWAKANGPLSPDEQATVRLMIRAQIARGMPDLIRACGLEREYGIVPLEELERVAAAIGDELLGELTSGRVTKLGIVEIRAAIADRTADWRLDMDALDLFEELICRHIIARVG